MRIAFCITELDPGGAEKGLYQLATRLDRSKWEVRVYCLGPEAELSRALRREGIHVDCYGAKSWRDVGAFFWLTSHLREFRPALLQGFLFHGNLLGRLAGRAAGVPVILAGHRVAEREKRWHLRLDRWTKQLVHHHVCVSRGVATYLSSQLHLRPEDVTIIPNGIVTSEEREQQQQQPVKIGNLTHRPAGTMTVLAVGRLHAQKGFLDLLAAFQAVAEELPESHLLIVGEGSQRRELEAEIHQRKLNKMVTLAGRRKDVLELMRQADVLALTSRWEGMPNVVLEAMSVGLPVVAMDVEGIRDVIQNEQLGIIVTPGDIKGFTRSLLQLLTRPDLAQHMGHESQQFVTKEFAIEKTVLQYERLFQRLIDN